jgi:hypothetical protein
MSKRGPNLFGAKCGPEINLDCRRELKVMRNPFGIGGSSRLCDCKRSLSLLKGWGPKKQILDPLKEDWPQPKGSRQVEGLLVKRVLAILLTGMALPIFIGSRRCRADDMSRYCQMVASVVSDASKARDAGTTESAFLAAQGANATDDIEKAIVSLVYKSAGLSTDSMRKNVFDTCTQTNGWANCKPLTSETGIACMPPE